MKTVIGGAAALCALCGGTAVAAAEPLDYGVVETSRAPLPQAYPRPRTW